MTGRASRAGQTQSQGERTVQGALENAIERVCGQRVRVTGAGRTDAGVHAVGQVASVRVATALSNERLRAALNAHLPREAVVRLLEEAPLHFDARRDARSKLYRYSIWNGAVRSPRRAARFHAIEVPLDLGAMQAAAQALVGEHDFASFQAAGSSVKTTVRRITRVDLVGEAGGEIVLEVEGGGFLRHMVRNLAGTLVEIGRGRREASGIPELLAARNRALAGPTAPAHGLTLVRVDYSAD